MRYIKFIYITSLVSVVGSCLAGEHETHQSFPAHDLSSEGQSAPQSGASSEQSPAGTSIAWQEGVSPAETNNLSRGNWLKKLEYFRRAGAVYQKNEDDVHLVESAYKTFHDTYRAERQRVDEMINALGIKEDDIAYVYDHQSEIAQGEVLKKITLSQQEIDQQVNAIKAAFKDIALLLRAFDEALAVGEKQIATSRSYIDISWQKYVEIDSTYNDQHAKMLLEEMQAMDEHLLAIEHYITQDLTEYSHGRINLLKEHIHTIEQARDILRKGGFPLSISEFSEIKKQLSQKVEAVKPPESTGSTIWSWIVAPFSWMWDSVLNIYHKI